MKRRGFLGALAALGIGSKFLAAGEPPPAVLPARILPPAGGWMMSGEFHHGHAWNTATAYANAPVVSGRAPEPTRIHGVGAYDPDWGEE